MGDWITGTFHDPDNANAALDDLIVLGYPRESISVVMNAETRKRYFGDAGKELTQEGKLGRGAAAGSAIGGTLAVIAAALATVAAGGGAIVLAVDARPDDAAEVREILSVGDVRRPYGSGSTLRQEA